MNHNQDVGIEPGTDNMKTEKPKKRSFEHDNKDMRTKYYGYIYTVRSECNEKHRTK
jgi:hypothetical protein